MDNSVSSYDLITGGTVGFFSCVGLYVSSKGGWFEPSLPNNEINLSVDVDTYFESVCLIFNFTIQGALLRCDSAHYCMKN